MKRFSEFSDISAAREECRRRFPSLCLDRLTWAQIRDLANGDLVPVLSGRKQFVLMKKEEVAPGGKLDQRNAEIARINAKLRAQASQAKAEARKWFQEKCGSDVAKALELCFPKKKEEK